VYGYSCSWSRKRGKKEKKESRRKQGVKNYGHLGTVLSQLIDERSAPITMCGREKGCII